MHNLPFHPTSKCRSASSIFGWDYLHPKPLDTPRIIPHIVQPQLFNWLFHWETFMTLTLNWTKHSRYLFHCIHVKNNRCANLLDHLSNVYLNLSPEQHQIITVIQWFPFLLFFFLFLWKKKKNSIKVWFCDQSVWLVCNSCDVSVTGTDLYSFTFPPKTTVE